MALGACRLAVTIDGWDAAGDVAPTYAVGSSVTGSVHVWVDAPVRCDGLDVRLSASPKMRGHGVGPAGPPERLFAGTWEPGEYDYRFSLPADAPPTYAGKLVAWKWGVKATVDIPWAGDPESEGELQLALATSPTGVDVTLPAREHDERAGSRWILPLSLASFVALGILCVGLAAMGFGFFSESTAEAVASGGGAALVLTLLVLGTIVGRNEAATVRVELTPRRASASYRDGAPDALECYVVPLPEGQVAAVEVALIVAEVVEWTTRRSSDAPTTHHLEHVLHREDAALTFDAASKSWRGSLPLPDPATVPCFSFGNPPGRGLVWDLEVSTTRRHGRSPERTRLHLLVRPVHAAA